MSNTNYILNGENIITSINNNTITIKGLYITSTTNLSYFLFINKIKFINNININQNKNVNIHFSSKANDYFHLIQCIIKLFDKTKNYTNEYECAKKDDENNREKIISSILNNINSQLKSIKIKFDKIKNMNGIVSTYYVYDDLIKYDPNILLICLYNKENCVSSILIDKSSNSINIDSKTHNDYEGKNYNKFLRSIIILIGKYIYEDVNQLYSSAISSTSAWILINNFNGKINHPGFNKFIGGQKITKELIIEYYSLIKINKEYGYLHITVDFNHENISIAQKIINDFIKINNE